MKEDILNACIVLFNQKGLKFTMDDLAKKMGMSKKTLYTLFSDKQALFLEMVDYLFLAIQESKKEVMNDTRLSTLEKIQKILGVMPESYAQIDFRQLYGLKDKYPKTYKRVENHLETGWEDTINLLEQGMKEGVIRKTSIPLVKMMLEASLEQFFQRDILIRANLTYQEALDEVVHILIEGIQKGE
ncbi:MAG: TetR/AcrR family transcriptional regulator [Bacillota bacterium]|nr:TetR/AcrR family transcriptional regulator [Bacillota bacterium]